MIKILIYGDKGYIGNILKIYFLKNINIEIVKSKYNKIYNDVQILDDIKSLKPDRIISTIGFTHNGKDNSTMFLNYDNFLKENIEKNLYIHLLISDVCIKNNIHFTYFSTGCIFHSINPKHIFNEDDTPNFFKNKYSLIKSYTDRILSLQKDKILIIRIRQCINNDSNPRNFLNKFMNFEKVSNIQNSFTVVPSIFPIILKLIIEAENGIINAVNRNSISVKEIVEIFEKKNIETASKEFILENYANNILSIKNLEKYGNIEDIKEALYNLKKS
jgi:3,5-epimerase/4-reductase